MTRYKKDFAHILIFLLFLFSICITSCKNADYEVSLKDSVMDLSEWDFVSGGPARLDGKWDFYFNQLLKPEDFHDLKRNNGTLQDVPKSWDNYVTGSGSRASADGFATYRIRLLMPQTNGIMAMKISSISTAYNLWIDGKLLSSSGVVSETKKDSFSKSVPKLIFFDLQDQEVDILIQASSYSYIDSGITKSIIIGIPSDLLRMEDVNKYLVIFFATIIMAISFYHFIIYFFRLKDKSILFLGVASFLLFIYILLGMGGYISDLFPKLSLQFEQKILIVVLMGSLPLIMLFYYYFFGRKMSKKINKTTRYVTFISMMLLLVLPFSRYNPIWPLFVIFILFNISYLFYFLIRKIRDKKENVLILFIGISILSFSLLYDISIGLIGFENFRILPIGISIFLFFNALAIAKKTARTIRDVEILSGDLEEMNMQMAEGYNLIEKIVEERTNQLKNAKENLELVNIELQKDKNLLRRIAVTDGLTKLYNHRFLINSLIKEINRADRYSRKLSIIMMDIDYFKKINDNFGHLFGDTVLKKVSAIIKENIRKVDIAGRYGGEEFLIILPETNILPAFCLAERVRKGVEAYDWNVLFDSKDKISITISGGVAEMDEENYIALLKKADNMLYLAKDNGRNRIEGY